MPRKTEPSDVNAPCAVSYFNEAAARCRGKPHLVVLGHHAHGPTSMRPRPDAAENLRIAAGSMLRVIGLQ